jgi:hypothetical protein
VRIYAKNVNPFSIGSSYIDDVFWGSSLNRDFFEWTFYGLTQGVEYQAVFYTLENSEATYWWMSIPVTPNRQLTTPTGLTYNSSSNSISANLLSGDGMTFVFTPTDTNDPQYASSYSLTERQMFYDVCLRVNESSGNKFDMGWTGVLRRWTKSSVVYKYEFSSEIPTGLQSICISILQDIMTEINGIISGSGVTFSITGSGSYDALVQFGTREEFGFIEHYDGYDYLTNGTWETEVEYGEIISALVKIAADSGDVTSLESIMREEIAQSMGAGNDWREPKYSFFFEFPMRERERYGYSTDSQTVLKILYLSGLPVGTYSYDVAKLIKVSTSVSVFSSGTLNSLSNYIKPNTEYSVKAYSSYQYHDGLMGQQFSQYSSTITFTYEIFTPNAVRLDSPPRVEGGLKLIWDVYSNAAGYHILWKPAYLPAPDEFTNWTGTTTLGSSSVRHTATSLQFGVIYDLKVRALDINTGDWTGLSPVSSYCTAPKTPSISQGTVTNTSITINTGSMAGNYGDGAGNGIQVDLLNSSGTYISSLFTGANSSVMFTGLTQGIVYKIRASSYFFVNGEYIYSVNYSNQLTITTLGRPTPDFEWTTAKTSGGIFNLTASEWNSFTAKINAFRVYHGKGTMGFTTFAAFMMNQALTGIRGGTLGGTYYEPLDDIDLDTYPLPSNISTNDIIYAWYFNNMRDLLKHIP